MTVLILLQFLRAFSMEIFREHAHISTSKPNQMLAAHKESCLLQRQKKIFHLFSPLFTPIVLFAHFAPIARQRRMV